MLTTNDISRLLTHYNLGRLVNVTQARRGNVNETAFIRTEMGRFVVRRSTRRLSEADLANRHQLTDWLVERDFPTPALIRASDGSTLINMDGRLYEIHEFVVGDDFDAEHAGQIASAGDTLARYHLAVDGFPPGPQPEPRYTPQTILGLAERLLERDMMGELYESLSWYDRRAAALRPIIPPQVYGTLPHLVIHGDVHADNFLFSGSDCVTLLDFDQATWDARIVDVADGLVAFATVEGGRNWMSWGVFQGPLDIERSAQLMRGYLERMLLSEAELELLPLLVELIWLQGELGRVIATPEGAPDYHQDVLEQGRWLSTWIHDNSDTLLDRWMDLRAVIE